MRPRPSSIVDHIGLIDGTTAGSTGKMSELTCSVIIKGAKVLPSTNMGYQLPMDNGLKGTVAVVTGGSSGIGRASALAFAAHGVRVAIGARRVAECEETVRLITEQGGEALYVQMDVSRPSQIEELVQAAVGRWKRLDFALNNAGIEGTPFVSTVEYSEEVWDEVIDVNLKGVFMSMKYEIPHMLKQRTGAIVNMSSVAGLTGGRVGAAYYASKHGVIGITKAAAMEYATSGIRVNAVCPGVIRTAMAERSFAGKEEVLLPLYPMGRFGTAEEVAEAVVWLCSGAASFITGHTLPLDGGFVAR
jgi:NAD(P)-dependent dehydrogenase (short-subunit alcohol dehydrogenase family)